VPTDPTPDEPFAADGKGQLVFQHGIGWLSVATVPFALVGFGVFVLGVYCGLAGKEPPGASLAMVGLGLGTSLLGLGLTFWQLRKVIDCRQRRVTSHWSVLGFSRTSEYRLDDFQAV
jgi:hypothetical protein